MNMLYNELHSKLIGLGAQENVPLSSLTTFRIGGPARYVVRPSSHESLMEILSLCTEHCLPYIIIGNGSNILACDEGYDGIVIRLDSPAFSPVFNENSVVCSANTKLSVLAKESIARGLGGLEHLAGIPGTVGGACAMNAGAYGSEIRDVLKQVRIIQDGAMHWVDVRPDDLAYRKSAFAYPKAIVVEAKFMLQPDEGAHEEMLRCTALRNSKQPMEYPSAGSVFKRPVGYFAGKLIEDCGLKAHTVGGAQVSDKHAGFIINRGGATCADVIELIELIQSRVFESFGVMLECEIKKLGREGFC